MKTYPAFWFIVALIAAVLYAWLPFMVLGVMGAGLLGIVEIWKERTHGTQA